MKSLLDKTGFGGLTKSSLDIRAVAISIGVAIGLCVAIYAITVDPNSATATIGFPP
jgi:hypothetical protein